MIGLRYPDIVRIVDAEYDGYGDESIESEAQVEALFMQTTGMSHSSNVDILNSDAHVYVNPNNAFVKDNFIRLEGMLLYANPFGSAEKDAWYKITTVRVGQDKLLGNQIDNIHLYLSKSVGIEDVS
jgi:hypothetical protein